MFYKNFENTIEIALYAKSYTYKVLNKLAHLLKVKKYSKKKNYKKNGGEVHKTGRI